jgi:hypothetical protein
MNRCFKGAAFFIFLLSFCKFAEAQTNVVRPGGTDTTKKAAPAMAKPIAKPKIKKPKPISKELSGGFRLNTDGWSVFLERGAVKSEERESDLFYDLRYTLIEFSEKKHPKETRTNSSGGSESLNSYVFGKINNFYSLKIGYGNRRMIAGKPDPGTVSVHWIYNGGLAIGMLKPYYLNISNGESIRYTDTTQDKFLTGYNIVGSAGFSEGLKELKIVPGLHVRTGLHFDFAPREKKKTKLALETGISAELYTKKIELMARQKAVPYFVNLYLSFQFGRRWE